jgi:hypothetical protein
MLNLVQGKPVGDMKSKIGLHSVGGKGRIK